MSETISKADAKARAEHARAVAAAMRAQGDHRTSLNTALQSWEREASRYEALALRTE